MEAACDDNMAIVKSTVAEKPQSDGLVIVAVESGISLKSDNSGEINANDIAEAEKEPQKRANFNELIITSVETIVDLQEHQCADESTVKNVENEDDMLLDELHSGGLRIESPATVDAVDDETNQKIAAAVENEEEHEAEEVEEEEDDDDELSNETISDEEEAEDEDEKEDVRRITQHQQISNGKKVNKSVDLIEINDDDDDDYDDAINVRKTVKTTADDGIDDDDFYDESENEISDDENDSGSVEAIRDDDDDDEDDDNENDDEDDDDDDDGGGEEDGEHDNIVDSDSDNNKKINTKQQKTQRQIKKIPKVQLSFRAKMKNRSVKCLNRRMLVVDVESSSENINKEQASHSSLLYKNTLPFSETTRLSLKTKEPTTTALDKKEKVKIDSKAQVLLDIEDDEMAIVPVEDSPIKLNGNSECVKNEPEKEVPKTADHSDIIKMEISDDKINEPIVPAEPIENVEKSNKIDQPNGKMSEEVREENAEENCKNELSKCRLIDNKEIISEVSDVPKKDSTDVPKIVVEPIKQITVTSTINESQLSLPTRPPPTPPPPPTPVRSNRKRAASDNVNDDDYDDNEEEMPAKKRLCIEVEKNFGSYDKLLREYIDKTSNNSMIEIQRHVDQLILDIQALTELAEKKEKEWNNILHLKKVKEEIVLRLSRKKNVMDIMSTKVGEVTDFSISDQSQPSLTKKITKELQNSVLSTNNNISVNSVTMVPLLSSTPTGNSANSTLQSIIQNRANMKEADLIKEKPNTARLHRTILPKPAHANLHSNYNSTSASVNQIALDHRQLQQLQQQQQHLQQVDNRHEAHQQPPNNLALNELLSRENQMAIGRQGAIKDVKSIIDDYRQKHPEPLPRRGRRFKGASYNGDGAIGATRNTDGTRQSVESRMSELGLLLTKIDGSSRPSSTESTQTINHTSTPMMKTNTTGFPEVTLHPVQAHIDKQSTQSSNSQAGSLLHGILTKNTRMSGGFTSYSPTLARLLTAPERITPLAQNYQNLQAQQQSPSGGINLTKVKSEITITPVVHQTHQQQHHHHQQQQQQQQQQQTILQQQLQKIHDSRVKQEYFMNMDDEADDSADRLVIDEGDTVNDQCMPVQGTVCNEFRENEVPECQGCKKREAQFVCAGCGHQWYCSRECQVSAWDEHSDVCTG